MCWNAEVSLNTFLFSFFVLCLIIYNNAYTQYKIQSLNDIWAYLFLASFIFVQLLEYFIWINIHNKYYNKVFSFIKDVLILSQPFFSLMLLHKISLRNKLLVGYLLYILFKIYFLFKFYLSNNKTINTITTISKKGHLQWSSPYKLYGWLSAIIWLFFFLFPFFYKDYWWIFAIATLFLSYYNYLHDNSFNSMWCWLANMAMIFWAGYLLFYLPFIQK